MQPSFTRAQLQRLKFHADEANRRHRIDQIVNEIYQMVLTSASSGMKCINYCMYAGSLPINGDPFIAENAPHILSILECLFPDCTISHTIMARGRDGKNYDISKIDDEILPLLTVALPSSYIVVDWS